MLALIAEDDSDLADAVQRRLEQAGYQTVVAPSAVAARELAQSERPDIILLDRLLPEGDGLDLLREWRAAGMQAPVLLLTALDQIEDRVEGLDAGADDYVGKPFAFSELVARVNVLARRATSDQALARIVQGPLEIDLLKREVSCDGQQVALQPREFRLLEELARNAGHTVTRQMLLENVWGFHFDPLTNIVETHMSRLRGKLALVGGSNLIETVRGEGYRLIAAGGASA